MSDWQIYKRILAYLRPYIPQILLVLVFNFLFVIFNTLSVWMVAPFINTLFSQPQAVAVQSQQTSTTAAEAPSIWDLNDWLKHKLSHFIDRGDRIETLKYLAIILFLTFLLKNLSWFLEVYWVSFLEERVTLDLRNELYHRLVHQPLHFFENYRVGNLISRVLNDVSTLNVAVNRSFTKVIRDPFMVLIFLFLLINISWQLTLVAFIVIPLSGVLIYTIGQSLKRKSRRVQEKIAALTSVLQETINGIKVVKAFSMEPYEVRKFREKAWDHYKTVLRRVRLDRLSSPLSETLGVGILVSVLWFGGRLVLQGQLLSPEDFIRFIVVLFSMMQPIKSLGDVNNNIQIAVASGQRIFELMDNPPEVREDPQALPKKDFHHRIEYRRVFFKYPTSEHWVLENIDLTIQKNEKIAFVGSSGAGKTTIVNLLPRFYEVTRGTILIDGIPIEKIALKDLRRLMGIVTQDVILFNDTVANNIAYGMPEYSREEIMRAAKLANAYDFIMELPQGFDTMVGERGMRLSGGQRQRISIARAILKNPPILIFDEATSSLDSESEKLIQQAIENLMEDRTVLMIAHRLSSIINADKIVLLENGKIIDMGTHPELLERSPRYRQLYELQFAG